MLAERAAALDDLNEQIGQLGVAMTLHRPATHVRHHKQVSVHYRRPLSGLLPHGWTSASQCQLVQ
jgi:hypothetical protein